jgi:hypothetical protein
MHSVLVGVKGLDSALAGRGVVGLCCDFAGAAAQVHQGSKIKNERAVLTIRKECQIRRSLLGARKVA